MTYNGVFVVDLTCVLCIDDLRADDNGVWTHAGKPQRKYWIRRDHETCGLIYADEPTPESEIFTEFIIITKVPLNFREEFPMFLIMMGKRCSMLLCNICLMVEIKCLLKLILFAKITIPV